MQHTRSILPATGEPDLLAAVRAYAPTLALTAAATAERGRLDPGVLADLEAMGVFRAQVPRAYGGLELPYGFLVCAVQEMGRYCTATAWVVGVMLSGSWRVAKANPTVQARFWANGPDARISSAFANKGARCERVEGGWRVSGEWMFCSGVHHADWVALTLPTTGEDGKPAFHFGFMPRADVQTLPTWRSLGLRGTGSDNLVVDDLFIPDEMTTPRDAFEEPVTPGQDGETYRDAMGAIFGYSVAAPLVGSASGVVDAYVAQLAARGRIPGDFRAPGQAAEMRIAESAADLDASRAIIAGDMALVRGATASSRPLDALEQARMKRNAAYVALVARRASQRVIDAMGARALDPDEPAQRLHADTCAGAAHISLSWELMSAPYAKAALASA